MVKLDRGEQVCYSCAHIGYCQYRANIEAMLRALTDIQRDAIVIELKVSTATCHRERERDATGTADGAEE